MTKSEWKADRIKTTASFLLLFLAVSGMLYGQFPPVKHIFSTSLLSLPRIAKSRKEMYYPHSITFTKLNLMFSPIQKKVTQ